MTWMVTAVFMFTPAAVKVIMAGVSFSSVPALDGLDDHW